MNKKFYFFIAYLLIAIPSIAQNVNFSANKTSGCGALAGVQFTDKSTITATSWSWDFGNNTYSSLQNPVASYASPGEYSVKLSISNSSGSYSETKTDFIVVHNKPSSNFNISTSAGCIPLMIDFTDSTILGDTTIEEFIWDFGDGSPENNFQNPSYTYKNKGSYNVSLQVIDYNGCTSTKQFSSIKVEERPKVVFTTSNSPYSCSAPYQVNFVNYTKGTGNIQYKWYFGDGDSSTQKTPSHTYTALGNYDVTLIATSNLCSDTSILKDFISLEPITADFEVSKEVSCWGEKLEFTSSSAGASTFFWEFGDGSTSRHKNPTKIYADSGTFIVKLRASSGASCVVNLKDTIKVQRVIANFELLEDTVCTLPAEMKFINKSTNGDVYKWNLGSSKYTSYNLDTLEVNFTEYGLHSDQLIATSNIGCADTLYVPKSRFLYKPSPQIIMFSPDGGCVPIDMDFAYMNPDPDSVISQLWDNGSVQSNLDTTTLTFSVDGTRELYLTVENTRGCIGRDTIEVNVGNKLILDPPNYMDTVCAGDTLFIERPIIDSTKNFLYQLFMYWHGTQVTETVYFDKDIPIPTLSDTGLLTLQHQVNYNGCYSTSVKDTLYVKGPIASFTPSPSDCNGSLLFNFTSTMLGVDRFYWDFGDGSPLDSVNLNPSHTFPADSLYNVELLVYGPDSGDCSYSFIKEVGTGPPPITKINYSTQDVCVGQQIYLSADIKNSYSDIKWEIGDSVYYDTTYLAVSSDTAVSLAIKLVAYSEYGCADSSLDFLNFHKPEAEISSDYVGGCLPLDIQFLDVSNSINDIISRKWTIDPFGNSIAKNPQFNIDRSMVISANLIVIDKLGCRDTANRDSMIVIEKNQLSFTVNDKEICIGDTVHFDNNSKIVDNKYIWYFGDGDSLSGYNAKHLYSNAGKYEVILKYVDLQNCVNQLVRKDFITVEAYPKANFFSDTTAAPCYPLPVTFTDSSNNPDINLWVWDFGDGIQSNFPNPFHNYLKPGNYDVKLMVSTANGCADSITKNAYIQITGPKADISTSQDTSCLNSEIVFKMINDVGVESFQWTFGDGTTSLDNPASHSYTKMGTYYPQLIVGDSGNACSVAISDTLFITSFEASFKSSETEICLNSSIDFTNLTQDVTKITWDFGDGDTSNLLNPSHTYTDSGTYVVTLNVEGGNDCSDTATTLIIVNPNPQIEISQDTLICLGDSIQLYSSGGNTYLWTPDSFLSDATISNPIAYPTRAIRYSLLVTNKFSCYDSTGFSIDIAEMPKSNLPKDTTLIIGESVYIINKESNGPGFTYEWSPTEGLNCSNCPNPLAKPMDTTLYHLNIKDPLACYSIWDSILINIKKAYTLNIPTAFTPNEDGNNDIIYARGWGIKDLLEFKIYNRWGELLFESSDVNIGWDGMYKGKMQNNETYVYTVRALMYDGNIISKKGNLNLMR